MDDFLKEEARRMDAIGVFEVDSYPEWPSGTITTFGPEIADELTGSASDDDQPAEDG